MDSMPDSETIVIGGVDAHSDTHEAAALDDRGALLGSESFATTFAGYAALLDWLRAFGHVDVVAIELTGAYAAGLVRYLREHDIRVLEVNQPHAHTRRRRGKSDPIDAEMAARLALAGKATTIPKQTDGIVESIRLLRVTRASAVKARSAAMVQLSELIITAPQQLREQLAIRRSIRGKASLCRKLRPVLSDLNQPSQAAKLALRSLARRIDTLDAEIAELDAQLQPLVAQAAPRTTQLLGISTGHAGQNIERLHSDGAFAALCAASPIPASSGRTTRHRLNYGGDRDANRTLHMIAVCRLRYCARTQAYAARRTKEARPSARSSAA
jgi:transposase